MGELRRTPLYARHAALGAKFVPFAGFELPVQYSGILEEHRAVRERMGLFDVSHMGEILVSGPESVDFLEKLGTQYVARLDVGRAAYGFFLNEQGGILDDVLLYRLNDEEFLVVANAANTDKVYRWLKEHALGGPQILDISDRIGLLALQGPRAASFLSHLAEPSVDDLRPFRFRENVTVAGVPVLLASRTGYTGEDGFELFVDAEAVGELWDALLERGREFGLVPCGLGARDTLRFEAGLPLYGQELAETITPLEANLERFVRWEKPVDFVGKAALLRQKEHGVSRILVGLRVEDRGIPRTGYAVFAGDVLVGRVTSGSVAPTLGGAYAMAFVDAAYAREGTELDLDLRGRRARAVVVPLPFYRRAG
ncbi:MAG: glycine cleavage system aminomethyltransferase GcvT [Brockia lithotrophica]|nr:glycine cleavage system aminomethyltransferase GcvT [Brockia lithotrophica]